MLLLIQGKGFTENFAQEWLEIDLMNKTLRSLRPGESYLNPTENLWSLLKKREGKQKVINSINWLGMNHDSRFCPEIDIHHTELQKS